MLVVESQTEPKGLFWNGQFCLLLKSLVFILESLECQ